MRAPTVDIDGQRIYVGDVRETLRELPDGSVDCCVTSPPYWGLRDYGTAAWDGGEVDCDHAKPTTTYNQGFDERWGQGSGQKKQEKKSEGQFAQTCGKCGATRVDHQIGLEPTPQEFVASLVDVFREVRRVLADHGTLWLNLGDSYVGALSQHREGGSAGVDSPISQKTLSGIPQTGRIERGKAMRSEGLKPKDLVGIPWRVALALQDDGWYLRSDVIWAKPNPMPESVTDRPTKSHEYVFMLTKQPRYFFDQEAVREGYKYDGRSVTAVEGRDGSIQHRSGERWPGLRPQTARARELAEEHGLTEAHIEAIRAVGITDVGKAQHTQDGFGKNDPEVQALADEAKAVLGGYYREFLLPQGGRNIRSVWEIATQPYKEAHFATFPEELPRRCIAAGCPTEVCRTCGKPRERIVAIESSWSDRAENGGTRGNVAVSDAVTVELGVRADSWKSEPEDAALPVNVKTSVSTSPTVPPVFVGAGTQRGVHGQGVSHDLDPKSRTVLGWSDCGHGDYRPGIVLDPFMGSGTTAKVARRLGRESVGVELNPEYALLAGRRLGDPVSINRSAEAADGHAQLALG